MEVLMARFRPGSNKGDFQSTSYGEGTELDNLQDNAEMFVEEAANVQLSNPEQVQNTAPVVQDIFRQTDKIGESLAANQLQEQYGMGVMESNMILRAMYRVLPSKDILALMDEDIFSG
jgi:hypothetical protein